MANRPRAARVALGCVGIALIALAVFAWKPLFDWVSLVRVPSGGDHLRGWVVTDRWSGRRTERRVWYAGTGFLYMDFSRRQGVPGFTVWDPDGTPRVQIRFRSGRSEARYSPPWWWGKADQTASSAPAWILDDQQWQAALDAQE